MAINIIDNIKGLFISSIESNISQMKDKISADILNMEISLLYQNKIYGEEAYAVQDLFSELSDNIDDVLNQYKTNCINSIINLLQGINYNKYNPKNTQSSE